MALDPKTENAKTVTIACKYEHGLQIDAAKGGPPGSVVLAGGNASETIGGYGFTDNVDGAFWRAWLAEHLTFPGVVLGMIFATEKPAAARDRAREQAGIITGFEGIDPERPREGVLVDNYEGRPKNLPVPGAPVPGAPAAPVKP